ncbi:hypothetical protein, partial [Gallintestinimicrobium sp.]
CNTDSDCAVKKDSKMAGEIKKNVPWHILAPRRGCFSNHLPLRRVRILAERFYRMETKFPYDKNSACRQYLGVIQLLSENSCMAPSCFCPSQLSKERS